MSIAADSSSPRPAAAAPNSRRLSPTDERGLSRDRNTSCDCCRRSIRSGTPKSRSIRNSCDRCGASTSAAARASCSAPTTCRATGNWAGGSPAARCPRRCRPKWRPSIAIGANVMAYATNRELKYKFESFATAAADAAAGRLRSRQAVRGQAAASGRVQCGARRAAQSAARGRRKAQTARQHRAARAGDDRPQAVPLSPGVHARAARLSADAAGAQAVAHLPGARRHAVCRRDLFQPRVQRSLQREMAAMFPEQRLERIPPSDPLFTPEFGGDDLSSVERREPQRSRRRTAEVAGPRRASRIWKGSSWAIVTP